MDERGAARAGSQRQTQVYVNERTDELNAALAGALPGLTGRRIEWRSPIAAKEHREYWDRAFVEVLGLGEHAHALSEFWPSGGPHWDALAVVSGGEWPGVILVEGKSYPRELYSGGCGAAKGSTSRDLIQRSLAWVQERLGVRDRTAEEWCGRLYQSANRLAHLEWLRSRGVDAWLVHLLFTGDPHSPTTEDEWHEAIREADEELGIAAVDIPHAGHVILPALDIEPVASLVQREEWASRIFVAHFALTAASMPSPRAPWEEIVHFAGSFDGYSVLPGDGALQKFVMEGRERFGAGEELPEGLTLRRTALHGEQRANYWSDGEPPSAEEMRYTHELIEGIRRLVTSGAHLAPAPWSPGGVRDKVMNAFERLLVAYASWGGHRAHGWTRQEDAENYLGRVVWSEHDVVLRFALELEKEWPGATHLEFALGQSTLHDYDAAVERGQRVDIIVSDHSSFVEDSTSQDRFLHQCNQAFFEVKWFKKGWRDGPFDMDARKRVQEVQADALKLDRHVEHGRCQVAAVVVFDDEGYFQEHGTEVEWPARVWRLVAGPSQLKLRGID